MSTKTTIIQYRRKREGRTDYKRRLTLLKSDKPRVIVRRSLDNISGQIAMYDQDGDKIIVSANSRELVKKGWNAKRNSLPASYLTGYLLGKKAIGKKVTEAVPDIGFHISTKGSRIYAFLKGMIDAGVKVNVGEDMIPSEDRLNGKHIADYAKALKGVKDNVQFSAYNKDGIDPSAMPKLVQETKKKITG